MTTDRNRDKSVFRMSLSRAIVFVCLTIFWGYPNSVGYAADVEGAPVPLLEKGHPVDWWFVFKFNSGAFPACRGSATRVCRFGGEVRDYNAFSQQYVYASSGNSSLQEGSIAPEIPPVTR